MARDYLRRLAALEECAPARDDVTAQWLARVTAGMPPNTPEQNAWAMEYLAALAASIKGGS